MTDPHTYSADNFMTLLPHVLDDDARMHALAYAISKALEVHLDEIRAATIYTRIDELPESLLDLLANDYKIDWYDFDFPIEAKRNLIKTNYYVHRHLGTYGAVLTAVRAIYPDSAVEEWFDYGGQAYHFRIALESAFPVIPFSTAALLTAVYRYKSLRSHLDGIVFRCLTKISIANRTGYAHYWGRIAGTWPQRARQGMVSDGALEVNTSHSGALAYSSRLCGTAPGGLF